MSLQLAAKHLAAKGRGPDTELVHMTMDELKSLQALAKAHGGSLTINPDTGLPEAGFLSSILPMVAGAALAPFTGGASMAALLVGGGTALATGNLEKGLMAGLGAFGGAGLAGGLMGAGTAAAQQGAISALGEGASQAAMNQAAAQATQSALSSPFSTMGQGLTGLTEVGGRGAFMNSIGGTKGLLTSGAAAAAPMLMGGEQYNPPGIKPTTPTTPLQFSANAVTPTPQPDVPGYGGLGQDFGRQQRYFNPAFTPVNPPAPAPAAPVTDMPDAYSYGGGMAVGGPVEAMSAANIYDMQNARGGVSDMGIDNSTGMQKMARGGISDLGDYSDGGRLLKGPGNGTSDDIPAMIGQKQPARLADGEFIIPARIVSEIGNGSTNAGARELYAMMDRIQRARGKTTGKGKVAVDAKARHELPA